MSALAASAPQQAGSVWLWRHGRAASEGTSVPGRSPGEVPVWTRCYYGEVPMWVNPHGNLTVVAPWQHRRGPGVAAGLEVRCGGGANGSGHFRLGVKLCLVLRHLKQCATINSVLAEVRAVPPSAAESLEQRDGIGITIGLGLREVDHGLLIRLLRVYQHQVAGITGFQLSPAKFKRDLGGIGFQSVGVPLSALNVPATFWKAVRTVLRYCSRFSTGWPKSFPRRWESRRPVEPGHSLALPPTRNTTGTANLPTLCSGRWKVVQSLLHMSEGLAS